MIVKLTCLPPPPFAFQHYIPKYSRYEKRHKNLSAHASPAFRIEIGDTVTVGQCRPLSKTVRFNVVSRPPQSILAPLHRGLWLTLNVSIYSPVCDQVRVAQNKAAAKAFAKF